MVVLREQVVEQLLKKANAAIDSKILLEDKDGREKAEYILN